MTTSIPSRSTATACPLSPQNGPATRDGSGGTHGAPERPAAPAARTTSPAIAALRPRTSPPTHNADPGAARPDHHVIDIDPPAPRAASPTIAAFRPRTLLPARDAGPGAARPDHHALDIDPPAAGANIAPPVVPIADRRARLRTLSNLQRALSAASTACSVTHLSFPGYGLDKAAWALIAANAPLTWAIVRGLREVQRAEADRLRHPELRGQALNQMIQGFCAPESMAARFDWSASGLFVNTANVDMTEDVSHILARAFAAAQTPGGSAIAPALRAYADNLASSAPLRAALAQAVCEANAACDDRVGVRLGELMLAGVVHMVRDKTAKPNTVVSTLVLHAATRAMEKHISALLAQGQDPEAVPRQPSAELMLTGSRAVQAALVRRGIAVPEVFPEHLFGADDLRLHRNAVMAAADSIAEACCRPPAPGLPAGHAIAAFLERHGGPAAEEILSTRLAHLTKPLEATLQRALAIVDEAKAARTDQQYRDTADKLMRDYNDAIAQARARAIAGALAGDETDWVVPEEPASTSAPEPVQGHGETSADAEADAGPAPHGYDPAKGKWKTS
ncbi:type III effector protein (plasmid) [Ralstonia solanacearum]|uniref:Type III effector protein n=1 Tax=Ralstonia solanacearum TaxID=305 RepID=A0AAD0SC84_RALSL|nr:type III effector protein [Ralstonia solanacearum]AXW55505.1 type III effector protein [Ralstonia solanacearum]